VMRNFRETVRDGGTSQDAFTAMNRRVAMP
jgi:hypothetical protein